MTVELVTCVGNEQGASREGAGVGSNQRPCWEYQTKRHVFLARPRAVPDTGRGRLRTAMSDTPLLRPGPEPSSAGKY